MSVSRQTQKRLPTIKAGLLRGDSYADIGSNCGVTSRTIDRDVYAWVESGGFETWIKQEWLRLHNQIIHEDPAEAYRQITKILGRMVTRKVESKQIRELREIKVVWALNEHNPTDKVQASSGAT